MTSLLLRCWPICRLRSGPQDLPWSPLLLLAAIAGNLLASTLLMLLGLDLHTALPRALFAVLMSVLIWSLVLQVAGRQARLLQTLTALQGCGMLMGLCAWLLLSLASALALGKGLLLLINLALLLWSLTVVSHILRQALERSLQFTTLLVLAVFFLRMGLQQQVFAS